MTHAIFISIDELQAVLKSRRLSKIERGQINASIRMLQQSARSPLRIRENFEESLYEQHPKDPYFKCGFLKKCYGIVNGIERLLTFLGAGSDFAVYRYANKSGQARAIKIPIPLKYQNEAIGDVTKPTGETRYTQSELEVMKNKLVSLSFPHDPDQVKVCSLTHVGRKYDCIDMPFMASNPLDDDKKRLALRSLYEKRSAIMLDGYLDNFRENEQREFIAIDVGSVIVFRDKKGLSLTESDHSFSMFADELITLAHSYKSTEEEGLQNKTTNVVHFFNRNKTKKPKLDIDFSVKELILAILAFEAIRDDSRGRKLTENTEELKRLAGLAASAIYELFPEKKESDYSSYDVSFLYFRNAVVKKMSGDNIAASRLQNSPVQFQR